MCITGNYIHELKKKKTSKKKKRKSCLIDYTSLFFIKSLPFSVLLKLYMYLYIDTIAQKKYKNEESYSS